MPPKPIFFSSAAEWRKWLDDNHADANELWVGFHKRATGKPSLTWPESVREALCYGWIDGVRHTVDDGRYKIRFTPRRPGSVWSAVNVKHVEELTKQKLMRPAGLAAFATRKPSKMYSYEQRKDSKLAPADQKKLESNRAAWMYFQSRPPSYQRTAIYWVTSAKQEETRQRRLARLIEDSANGRLIGPMAPKKAK